MKRVLLGLLGWLLSAQLALAAVGISFTDNTSTTTTTSPITFATRAIGTAAADRIVFVSILGYAAASATTDISSVTIGGISATQAFVSGGSSLQYVLATYWAVVPTGTTASVVVTASGSNFGTTSQVLISIYRVDGANTTTPVTATPLNSAGGSTTGTIATGGAFQSTYFCTDAAPTTWTNATENMDASITAGGAGGAFSTANRTTAGAFTVGATASCTADELQRGVVIQQASGGAVSNPGLLTLGVGP